MAVVLQDFICKETRQLHRAGEVYEGDRAEELAKLGHVAEDGNDGGNSGSNDWPNHVGGGYYELSNGDKVKGKEAALEAQAEISASDD